MHCNTLKIVLYWIIPIGLVLAGVFAYLLLGNSVYFSDRLFVVYKDANNKSQAIMIALTRYNTIPHLYEYHYRASWVGHDSAVVWKDYEYRSFASIFKPVDFIKKIINTNNENILEENYAISIELDNKKIDIDLKQMTGDFLINNSLDRFTYINMGTTTVVIDGRSYPASFVLNKSASMNYIKSMREQAVAARGMVAFFSDLAGELFYTDITTVFEEKSRYMSHAWVLNKNGKTLKKDTGEKIVLASNTKDGIVLDLANFHKAKVGLKKISSFREGGTFYNLLEGELVDENGTRIVTGFSLEYDDTK